MLERKIDKSGYVRVKVNGEWKQEHRYIMEQTLGRKLERTEYVHHIDKNPSNNALSNLELVDAITHYERHKAARTDAIRRGAQVASERRHAWNMANGRLSA